MNKKLTDNEIKKALEDFKNSNIIQMRNYTVLSICDVLGLINRLESENENLKDILYDAEGVNLVNYWHQQFKIAENGNRNFDEENKSLKAEIERLNNELAISQTGYVSMEGKAWDLREQLKTAKAENEKLYQTINDMASNVGKINEKLPQMKAEAYKECFEEIKSYYKETRFAYEADNLIEEIEDLLKEKLNYVR